MLSNGRTHEQHEIHGAGGGAGRTYAAYGGMYVTVALVVWLWPVDGVGLWDLAGAGIALVGMAIQSQGSDRTPWRPAFGSATTKANRLNRPRATRSLLYFPSWASW